MTGSNGFFIAVKKCEHGCKTSKTFKNIQTHVKIFSKVYVYNFAHFAHVFDLNSLDI